MDTAVLPDVRRVGGLIGAEIRGLDLTQDYPDETYAAVRRALDEHGVVFFRDQFGEGWHSDMTCFDPPLYATMLFAEEVPSADGDTQRAGMGPVFEALPPGPQSSLLRMRAVHANVRKPGLSYEQTDPPEPSVAEYDAAEGSVPRNS